MLKHQKLSGILVRNQFHEQGIFLDTVEPDRLMVPSLKTLSGSIQAIPDPFPIDHFKCYKVKVTKGTDAFVKQTVSVSDQFEQPTMLDVKKPTRLCNPVSKDGGEIGTPDSHLLCYKVKRAKGEPRFEKVEGIIHTANQFGSLRLDAKKEKELCIPSEKDDTNAVPIPSDKDDDD